MGRKPLAPGLKRPEVKIYPTPEILAWIDQHTGPGNRFYNRTHAIEVAVAKLMQEEKKPGKQD